jgi:hypothetical protein
MLRRSFGVEHGPRRHATTRQGCWCAGPGAPVHGHVPEPLRVELRPRDPILRCATLLGWPLGVEQFFNAKLLADWGICVELACGNMESSEVMRVTMGEAVCAVMGEAGKGEEMRRRAASVSRALVDVWELHGGSSA